MKLTKHDQYVNDLCEKIRPSYDSLLTNVEIRSKKRSFGEVDILARKGERIDIYEVKCSHRIVKARKQLSKLRKFVKSANSYFYCGSSGLLMKL